MTTTLKAMCKTVRLDVTYGAAKPWGDQDEWQQNPNGYRCTLRYKGRRYTFDFWQGVGITDDPTAAGVLECLLSDSTVSDDFEEFCSEFGYDTDSRKAEATHKACVRVGENIKRLLGDDYDEFLQADR